MQHPFLGSKTQVLHPDRASLRAYGSSPEFRGNRLGQRGEDDKVATANWAPCDHRQSLEAIEQLANPLTFIITIGPDGLYSAGNF